MAADDLIPAADPESVGFSSTRLDRIGRMLASYVDDGKLPFAGIAVARHGMRAYHYLYGMRDIERQLPVLEDGLYRIYSMTKPVTTVAAMSLFEEGRFLIDDPITLFLPELSEQKVWVDGPYENMELVKPSWPPTMAQLMTHTAGYTYGLFDPTPVGRAMRRAKADFSDDGGTLAEVVSRLANVPLRFDPGDAWNYGVSTDVLGRIVEVIAGKPFEQVLRERIFEPLGMSDTSFSVADDQLSRFCALYTRTDDTLLRLVEDAPGSRFRAPVTMHSGGGGLVSTVSDYLRFCEMLRRGGMLGGESVLGRKTVSYMMRNHLPGDIASMGDTSFSEMPLTGVGFGLGGSVLLDPVRSAVPGSPGEFAWGGMASTAFWIDPAEEISVVFVTQLIPSSSYPVRRQLRALVYQALID